MEFLKHFAAGEGGVSQFIGYAAMWDPFLTTSRYLETREPRLSGGVLLFRSGGSQAWRRTPALSG